jgi:hypothetical protein
VGKADDDVGAGAEVERRIVDVARKHRERGNDSYKTGDLKDAMDYYQVALLLLQDCGLTATSPSVAVRAEGVAVQGNMALVLLKVAEGADHAVGAKLCRDVVNFTDCVLALDPGNDKARHRRSKALVLFEEYARR